ncbi:caspase family protein [Scytonema sp. NUACC21]
MLVGVNQYQDERLPNLRYSAVDCQSLAEALTKAAVEFTEKEVKIFHDFAEQLPFLDNVLANLQQITAAAKPIDTILFYFSGHGMIEENSHQGFLCLTDTQKDDLLGTALSLTEILKLLTQCAAQNQVVWLDACHSGGLTLRGTTTESLLNPTLQFVKDLQEVAAKSHAKSKGFYALLSCDTNQQSWEFPELGHGVFTYFLIRGLRGDAADSQGLISVDGLYRYVYHQTLQYIDKTNQQRRLMNQQKRGQGDTQLFQEYPLQTPKRIVEGVGELVLGKTLESLPKTHSRLGIIVEGLSAHKTTLEISKRLGSSGVFELEYLPAGKVSTEVLKEAISNCLHSLEAETILLYLRGQIEETESWEGLILGENIRIKRSWLKQQLHECKAKQMIILDCLAPTSKIVSLKSWVEDLLVDSQQGQCLIACISKVSEPEKFAQTFLSSLMTASVSEGLSAAAAIAKIQISLAGSAIPLHVWLSGTQGIIEVLPSKTERGEKSSGLDLGVCPYMGLTAFSEEDSQYFYGRETLIQQLLHQLANSSFLTVVGASGSGKSSVVQAGLIPNLRLGKQIPNSDGWWIGTLRPGSRPLETLALCMGQGLSSSSPSLLEGILYQGVESFVYWMRSKSEPMVVLVIDQFEELFTLAPALDREKFLELVLGAVQYASDRFKLIVTLRADFISPCLEIPELAKVLQESSVLVPSGLSLDDYRHVIVNPAQQVGLKVEPELVEVLLRELDNSSGDLPLLEFVLEQLWQHRVKGELTLQVYQKQLGGIQGALQRSCQAVYESLDAQAQECAKWIFLSLTQLGEGTEDTRRRIHKSELMVKKYPKELVERTLKVLTDAKLVVVNLAENAVPGGARGEGDKEKFTPSSPLFPSNTVTVEVAHEILIRHWSTLRWWLEENRERLRKQRQIEHASQLWLQSDRQFDFLLQGVRLAEAEDIYIKYTNELSADVQRFIEACLLQRKQQQLQEKRRLRQAQRAVVALSVLGVAACTLGSLAYLQRREAQLREIEALNSSSEANLLSHQHLEAALASVKAAKQLKSTLGVPTDVVVNTMSLLAQVLADTQERNRFEDHKAWVASIDFSSDGRTIASGSADRTIKLWKQDGLLLRTIPGHSDLIYSVRFAPDGTAIASASADKTIKLWSVKNGQLLKTIEGHQQTVNGIGFSPDGTEIASASADKTIKLWKTSNGQLLRTLVGHTAGAIAVSFSPQGDILASTSEDRTIKLWKASDGTLLKTLTGHRDWINSVTFSPDGRTLASASTDKTVKLWNVTDGRLLKTLSGHTESVWGVRFSPNGKTLASASRDNTIKIWSRNGVELETFTGHSGGVYDVSFSPDSQTIASASNDNTIKLWQRRDISLLEILAGHNDGVESAIFSPNGKIVASGSLDGTIKLWRGNDGVLLKTLPSHGSPIYGISFTPDGQTLASSSADSTVKLWRISNGQLLRTFTGHSDEVNGVSFSPDGKTLATASRDNNIKLWSRDGSLLHTFKGHKAEVYGVSFSPDGKTIASASADNTIKLWSVDTKSLLKTLQGHDHWVYGVSFSPDGKTIASASADRTVKVWSRDGQLLRTLVGHTAGVYSSSFSPDSQTIASASEDKTVKLWHIDGRLLATLQEHQAGVMGVSFSPNGKTFVSASLDGKAKLWRFDSKRTQTLTLDSLMVSVCDRLQDYLKTNPKVSPENRQLCSTEH